MARREGDGSSASLARAVGLAAFFGCVLLGVVFQVPPPAGGCRATPSRRPQQRERACSPCTDPAAVPMRRRCAGVRCSTVPPTSIVLGFSH